MWRCANAATAASFSTSVGERHTVALVLTVVHGDLEWDADKDFADGLHPENLVTLAASPSGRILYVVSTERDRRIRIISARDATRHERRRYEEAR